MDYSRLRLLCPPEVLCDPSHQWSHNLENSWKYNTVIQIIHYSRTVPYDWINLNPHTESKRKLLHSCLFDWWEHRVLPRNPHLHRVPDYYCSCFVNLPISL